MKSLSVLVVGLLMAASAWGAKPVSMPPGYEDHAGAFFSQKRVVGKATLKGGVHILAADEGRDREDGGEDLVRTFELFRLERGTVRPLGSYILDHIGNVVLVEGPDGMIYTGTAGGDVWKIDPETGAQTLVGSSRLGLDEYSLSFSKAGELQIRIPAIEGLYFTIAPGGGSVANPEEGGRR